MHVDAVAAIGGASADTSEASALNDVNHNEETDKVGGNAPSPADAAAAIASPRTAGGAGVLVESRINVAPHSTTPRASPKAAVVNLTLLQWQG